MEDPRKQIIAQLREKRYSYRKISEHLGISRQRVHQILTGYRSPHSKPKPYTELKTHTTPIAKLITSGIQLQGRDFIREAVRRRDGYSCQICGKVWEEGKRRFDVHHIDAVKEKTQQYDNYDIEKDNMITLCHRCHLNLEVHRKKLSTIKQQKSI